MAAQLLGEDGLGYELARRLEACGAWRAWLGDDAALAQHLSSPSAWDAFLSPAPAAAALPPRPLLLLQLRVRALLFDKASAALLLSRGAGPHSVNANCECIPHPVLAVPGIYYLRICCWNRCVWIAGDFNLAAWCSRFRGILFAKKRFRGILG
jgi:hypothetical protein